MTWWFYTYFWLFDEPMGRMHWTISFYQIRYNGTQIYHFSWFHWHFLEFYLIHRKSDEVLSWCCVCCLFIHLSKITISPRVLSRFYSNLYRMFTNYIIMVCRCAPGGSASHTLDFIVVSRKSLANSCSLKLFAGLTKIHIQISYGLSVEMVEAASQVLGNFFIGVSSSACCNILGTIFFVVNSCNSI